MPDISELKPDKNILAITQGQVLQTEMMAELQKTADMLKEVHKQKEALRTEIDELHNSQQSYAAYYREIIPKIRKLLEEVRELRAKINGEAAEEAAKSRIKLNQLQSKEQ